MNPFGDSDDDSDDEFNPFAPKKTKAPAPQPEPEPEPDPIVVPKPLVSQPRAPPESAPAKSNGEANWISTNPFDQDNQQQQQNDFAPKSVRPLVTKKINPMPMVTDDFDFGNHAGSDPFAEGGAITEDVFASPNPITPSKAKAVPDRHTHTRSKTTGNISMEPSTATTTIDFEPNFQDNVNVKVKDTKTSKPKPKATPVKKSLFGLRGGKQAERDANASGELTPIAATMDQDEQVSASRSQHGGRKAKGVGVDFETSVKAKSQKPSFLNSHNRSKTESSISIGNGATAAASPGRELPRGWLRGANKVAVADEQQPDAAAGFKSTSIRTPKRNKKKGSSGSSKGGGKSISSSSKRDKKKNVFVQCWPYDDYHKDQEKYYESIQERGGPSPRSRKKKSDGSPGYANGIGIGSRSQKGSSRQANAFTNENNMFDRPADLPSIKEAVQNLSLFDFENTAEQRAISIVSTWLFEAGLIDELLINGTNTSTYRTPLSSSGASVSQNTSISIGSMRSSEGVEVGAHGFPLEGGLKIDKETEKLRANTQRELTLINTRLNDGVAASGSEVQELVNAVSATKNELGRLRELATYISSGYKKDGGIASKDSEGRLLLADYSRLKKAINARRNIFRCFRELEFFSQIPMTCDRLREELHQGEWTDNEWNSIRNVCMEHVELEILLVEAEAGMKKWLDDEDDDDDESSMPSIRSNRSLRRSWKGRHQSSLLADNHQVVDNFLSQHVKNVWELGKEIRMRILSGVGSAFDLALQNPAGMVALVEAVEVYERAADEYKDKASRWGDDESVGSDKNHLKFTDMRAAALAQLYEDFELRGLEIFRAIHMQAADLAEEDDALNTQFNAVLRAATELVTEIDVVKNQMSPCFAPHWHVEMLWSTCVAHVCSNQIIQQIGGPEGNSLSELNVTQLLDLVAWVEFFRETIEDSFPSIGAIHATKKTYFQEKPDLFAGNDKKVNMENAQDSLAWANNMLWDVHRLARDEFLYRTRIQTEEWVAKVYDATHETTQTREGRLVTSLCEDVFSLAGVQLRTIRERLTRKSDALVMAVCLIITQLQAKQLKSRNKFLSDLESCCAAANDFQRMSEKVEDMVQDIIDQSDLPEESVLTLEEGCGALVQLYSGDAVFAAQKAHCFIFEPIWESISEDLFGPKWELELTHNELALTLVRTLVSLCLIEYVVLSFALFVHYIDHLIIYRMILWAILKLF